MFSFWYRFIASFFYFVPVLVVHFGTKLLYWRADRTLIALFQFDILYTYIFYLYRSVSSSLTLSACSYGSRMNNTEKLGRGKLILRRAWPARVWKIQAHLGILFGVSRVWWFYFWLQTKESLVRLVRSLN